MANGRFFMGKPSGGTTEVSMTDGATNTSLVLPESGTVATREYISSIKDINYKSTPVLITSWSYVGTTITLNVASHSFVAGDYIEVAGLTATTYPANGIQLVSSVTATTIVFTLGATPTGTAGVSSATVKGYATINGRVSEGLGVNQLAVNVSTSRVIGSTYYNTTKKTKLVMISCLTTGGYTITASTGGVAFQGSTATSGAYGYIVFPVLAGNSYTVSMGTPSTLIWIELS